MKLLEDRIRRDGIVREGNILKVDSFLNHQIDVGLLNEMGREFFRLFGEEGVNKILTIEASGIGIACIAAQYFKVPVVFAKKAAGPFPPCRQLFRIIRPAASFQRFRSPDG